MDILHIFFNTHPCPEIFFFFFPAFATENDITYIVYGIVPTSPTHQNFSPAIYRGLQTAIWIPAAPSYFILRGVAHNRNHRSQTFITIYCCYLVREARRCDITENSANVY